MVSTKHYVIVFSALCLFFYGLITVAGTDRKDHQVAMVGAELLNEIQNGSAPIIIDVRTEWEFHKGHVPGAVNLPFQRAFYRHSDLAISKDQPILVYCEHGPRAYIARAALRRAGFKSIVLLKGQLSKWKKSGLPMEK